MIVPNSTYQISIKIHTFSHVRKQTDKKVIFIMDRALYSPLIMESIVNPEMLVRCVTCTPLTPIVQLRFHRITLSFSNCHKTPLPSYRVAIENESFFHTRDSIGVPLYHQGRKVREREIGQHTHHACFLVCFLLDSRQMRGGDIPLMDVLSTTSQS